MTMLSKHNRKWARACWLGLAGLILGVLPAAAQITITNVSVVNVTPSGFSVVAAVSPALTPSTTAAISVFAGARGGSNLAGQVGVEYYPLNSGDPTATNSYSSLLSIAALRQDSMNLGLFYARVSYCAPNTTYYYQITVTNTANGQSAVWPPDGPLPAATTAQENSFVVQSQQLLVTLNDSDPPGSIITLSTSNSSSVLAAVVGDGTPTNQAFFNVNDLIAAAGGTNYSPVGTELFTATVLGASSQGLTQTYDLVFSTNFTVGQGSTGTLGALATTIGLGDDALLTGTSGSVPITVNAQSALVGLSFTLSFPRTLFSELSVQATTPALQAASLTGLPNHGVELSFTAVPGMNLQGSQQIAQLNFTVLSNQSSAFVSLWPQAPQGSNANGSAASVFYVQPGRLAVIGPQPLLDTQLSGGARNLVLYGIPGESYQIQFKTNLIGHYHWLNLVRVPMTNISDVISNIDPTPVESYFRAYQFITEEAIVDSSLSPTGEESFVIYGAPGQAYEVDYMANVGNPWTPLTYVPLINSFAFVNGLNRTSTVYYRFVPLNANPPILQGTLLGTNRSLVAYGLAGTNYTLQSSTNLSATVAWHPLLSYTLTNSFQFISNLGNPNPVFYRIKKQ
jgi:hypothetical protein